MPEEETTTLLTTNAARVYNFDLDALASLAEQHCPTKAEVAAGIDYSMIPEEARVSGHEPAQPEGSGRRLSDPALEIEGTVAVVTGGANGIGKGIVKALLNRGATVVVADIEQDKIDETVAEFADLGPVSGMRTDVTDEASVGALADHVFATHGKCNLLFNNAGVTSGGGGKPWQQEPNDWRWCFGVNVFGVGIGTSVFVSRMIESGEPGQVVNTSSGDGGFAPVPTASVRRVEGRGQLLHRGAPSQPRQRGDQPPRLGLLSLRRDDGHGPVHRPAQPPRASPASGGGHRPQEHVVRRAHGAGRQGPGEEPKVADLDELGEFVVDCVAQRRYIIAKDLDDTVDLLHRRADAIGRYEIPPCHDMGI